MYPVEGLHPLENHVGNPASLVPLVLAVKTKILNSPVHLPHYMAFVTALMIKMQICIFPFDYIKCMSKTMQVFFIILGNSVSDISSLSINC